MPLSPKRANGPTGQRANGPTGQRANGPTGQRANGPTGQRLSRPLTLACTVSLTAALLAPVHAQTLPSFTGTYYGGDTSITYPTPTTQEVFDSVTSTDATNGLDSFSGHEFFTISGSNYFLTPGTTSTFTFSATDGSSVSGIITEDTGSFGAVDQTFTEVCSISVGTGRFLGATGNILLSNGNGNLSGSQEAFQVLGTSPVPEASTTVSFGLMLALGVSGFVVAVRKKKTKA